MQIYLQPLNIFAMLLILLVSFIINSCHLIKTKNRLQTAGNHHLENALIASVFILLGMISSAAPVTTAKYLTIIASIAALTYTYKTKKEKKACRGYMKSSLLYVPIALVTNLLLIELQIEPNLINSLWSILVLGIWSRNRFMQQQQVLSDLESLKSKLLSTQADIANMRQYPTGKVVDDKWPKAG